MLNNNKRLPPCGYRPAVITNEQIGRARTTTVLDKEDLYNKYRPISNIIPIDVHARYVCPCVVFLWSSLYNACDKASTVTVALPLIVLIENVISSWHIADGYKMSVRINLQDVYYIELMVFSTKRRMFVFIHANNVYSVQMIIIWKNEFWKLVSVHSDSGMGV